MRPLFFHMKKKFFLAAEFSHFLITNFWERNVFLQNLQYIKVFFWEFLCMHMDIHMHAYVYSYACICMSICMHMYTQSMHICICMHICMHINLYACICVHICMHMHAYKFPNKNFYHPKICDQKVIKFCSEKNCFIHVRKKWSLFLGYFFLLGV